MSMKRKLRRRHNINTMAAPDLMAVFQLAGRLVKAACDDHACDAGMMITALQQASIICARGQYPDMPRAELEQNLRETYELTLSSTFRAFETGLFDVKRTPRGGAGPDGELS